MLFEQVVRRSFEIGIGGKMLLVEQSAIAGRQRHPIIHMRGRSRTAADSSLLQSGRTNRTMERTKHWSEDRPKRRSSNVAKDHGPSVKDDKQYEGLRKKGMSKQRAARIANDPESSKKGGNKSSSGGKSTTSSKAGGTKAQKAAAGRKGGRKSS
jgi:hypothetical protein